MRLARISRLCDACLSEHVSRIEKVISQNLDKDVDWWARFWAKDEPRQIKRIMDHCDSISVVAETFARAG